MAKERRSWEDDTVGMGDIERKMAPPPDAPVPLVGKASESSTLRGSEPGRQDDHMNEDEHPTKPDVAEEASRHSEGTTSSTQHA
ncbi:hypothetical protein D0Z07_1567 [Hyphodiscus hymeniophilus]|uniref:Uncharacterized protein n=1 Tax=Hyphodiscus hymeniophilus TaxID=353542 RepID=A0A9P6VQ69_9HELO|nr:hypothetical protein D0Z07_1567 [Hyphodiscus hymeniophilus]